MTNLTPNIRKKVEYDEFIKIIEGSGAVAHWSEIARIVGVDKDTITAWKQHPWAIEARVRGIGKAIREMEESGKNDWRMWEAKLKMLGIRENDTDEEQREKNKIQIERITITREPQRDTQK